MWRGGGVRTVVTSTVSCRPMRQMKGGGGQPVEGGRVLYREEGGERQKDRRRDWGVGRGADRLIEKHALNTTQHGCC